MDRNLLLCDGPCKRAFHFRCLMLRVVLLAIINTRKRMWGVGNGSVTIA